MRYTMTQIMEATNFNAGDEFASDQEVRDYFTVDSQKECFGADATLTQDELDAMAGEVIANRWHMKDGDE